jgi:cell wall-associated NlpC family hydrolase
MLVLSPAAAHADPDPATIEAQIDAEWRQAEPLIEQYNAVHDQYQSNLAKQAELTAAIKPLADQLDVAEAKVGKIAAQAYMTGNAHSFNAVLTADSPATFADQLTLLDSVAIAQTGELSNVLAVKAQYDQQKAPIDALVTELAAENDDLTKKKADIDNRLAQLQQLRSQAYVASGATSAYYRPQVCPTQYEPTPGYKAAAFACGEAGKPYVWDAAGPSAYDCSGLTMVAWQQVGVYLPHNAAEQRQLMPYVNESDLQIGDLVFYYSDLSHVAIYVGNGMVMSAPSPGDVVRMLPMRNGAPIHSFGRPG